MGINLRAWLSADLKQSASLSLGIPWLGSPLTSKWVVWCSPHYCIIIWRPIVHYTVFACASSFIKEVSTMEPRILYYRFFKAPSWYFRPGDFYLVDGLKPCAWLWHTWEDFQTCALKDDDGGLLKRWGTINVLLKVSFQDHVWNSKQLYINFVFQLGS